MILCSNMEVISGCSGCSASDELGVNTYVDAIKYI